MSAEEKADQSWEQRSIGKGLYILSKTAFEYSVDEMKQSMHRLFTAYCRLSKSLTNEAYNGPNEIEKSQLAQNVSLLGVLPLSWPAP